jgi:hypothetical protein
MAELSIAEEGAEIERLLQERQIARFISDDAAQLKQRLASTIEGVSMLGDNPELMRLGLEAMLALERLKKAAGRIGLERGLELRQYNWYSNGYDLDIDIDTIRFRRKHALPQIWATLRQAQPEEGTVPARRPRRVLEGALAA